MSLAAENTAQIPTISRPLRLATLVGLRWLAVAGQTVAVLIVVFELGYALPVGPVMALIGLSALLNLGLTWRVRSGPHLDIRFATVQLAYDLIQLGGLLYLTGGLANPFALLLLAPLSVSATTLPQTATVSLSFLYTLIVTALALVHQPLPWAAEAPLVLPPVYIFGIWVSLVSGAVFVSAYTNRVAHEARQLFDALTATELALSRQHELSALDGLAAAAAHELGTPLSTIALAAKEIRADVEGGAVAEDLDLIIEQSGRCRAILGKLRSLNTTGPDPFAAAPIRDILAEVVRPYQTGAKSIEIEVSGAGDPPVVNRNIGLLYGLGNLVENAADFARARVTVAAVWDVAGLTVTITDDGPGFPGDLLTRLGEPYLTTRAHESHGSEATKPGGLGLGVFIAKTLLERTGAKISFANTDPKGHAQVIAAWPRRVIELAGG